MNSLPVQSLKEFCELHKWAVPEYEFARHDSKVGRITFQCSLKLPGGLILIQCF